MSSQAELVTFNFEGKLDDPSVDYVELGYPENALVTGSVTLDTGATIDSSIGDSTNCTMNANGAVVSYEATIEGYPDTFIAGDEATFSMGYQGAYDRNWLKVSTGYQLANNKEEGIYHPVVLSLDFDFKRSDSTTECYFPSYKITEMVNTDTKHLFQAHKYGDGPYVKNILAEFTIDSVVLDLSAISIVEMELRDIADSIDAMKLMNRIEMANIEARLIQIRRKTEQ